MPATKSRARHEARKERIQLLRRERSEQQAARLQAIRQKTHERLATAAEHSRRHPPASPAAFAPSSHRHVPPVDDMQMGIAAPQHFAPRPVVDHRPGGMMPSLDPAAPTIRAAPTHVHSDPSAPRTTSAAGGMMRQVDPAAPTFGHLQREGATPAQGPALGPGGLVRSPDPAAPTFGRLQGSRAPAEPMHGHPVAHTHFDPPSPAVYTKK